MNVCSPIIKANANYYKQIAGNNKHKQILSFKGNLLTTTLEKVDTNILLSLVFLDLISMIIPRTAVDFTRSEQAGWETLRSEVGGPAFDTLYPVLAAYAFALVSKAINNPSKIETRIHADREMMDTLTSFWKKAKGDKNTYIKSIIDNIEGLNGTDRKKLKEELLRAGKNSESIVTAISNAIKNNNLKKLKEAKDSILKTIGANRNVRIKGVNGNIETSLDNLLRDMYDLGRHVFFNNKGEGQINKAVTKLKKLNLWKSGFVLGSSSLIAFSIQPFNAYLTKRKTGKDGFVGNPDFHKNAKKDKSHTLLLGKVMAAIAFGLMILSTITGKGPIKSLAEFTKSAGRNSLLKKFEFNDKFLNINQLKLTFAALVTGRIFAARDKNELREISTRDSLGFLHYLVLGGFVTKGVANYLQHKKKNLYLINESKAFQSTKKGVGRFIDKIKHFIFNKSVKSHAEIRTLKGEIINKNICALNCSILSGIVYTCTMLGIGIPLLNKFITNKLVKKIEDKHKTSPIHYKIEISKKNKELFEQFIK